MHLPQLAILYKNLLIILPFTNYSPMEISAPRKQVNQDPSEWDYMDTTKWNKEYPSCGGWNQSPINLQRANTIGLLRIPLYFLNYNDAFNSELILKNNGHTAEITLPETLNGYRPMISGGLLTDQYEAQSIHFHWGSPLNKGSEHAINGCRYDAEIHIVHKNIKYRSVSEATQNPDGIAVLGIMIEIIDNPFQYYKGLNEVFSKISSIKNPETNVTITPKLTLRNFLGNIDTRKFYAYQGSFTNPPCSEAVTWHVLAEPLLISRLQLYNLFALKQKDGSYLLDNYRPLQPLNNRKIYTLGYSGWA